MLRHLTPTPTPTAAAGLCPRVAMAPGGPMVSEVIAGAMRFTGAGYSPEETLSVVKQIASVISAKTTRVHRPRLRYPSSREFPVAAA